MDLFSAFRNCIPQVNPIISCRITYGFLVALILKLKVQFPLFNNYNRASTRMRFKIDQNSSTLCGFILEFNTESKAVISYLFRSHLLKLQARTITVLTMDYAIMIMVFRRPKWQIKTAYGRQQARILIVTEYERTPYQYCSVQFIIYMHFRSLSPTILSYFCLIF